MSPESTPEERILPVMVPVLGWKKEKQSGQLVVLTQMKRSEVREFLMETFSQFFVVNNLIYLSNVVITSR